jgi:hypothetical protein
VRRGGELEEEEEENEVEGRADNDAVRRSSALDKVDREG